MNEGKFEQNFVWYEWSFVSPAEMSSGDVGADRARTSPTDVEGYGSERRDTQRHAGGTPADAWRVPGSDGYKPWTT